MSGDRNDYPSRIAISHPETTNVQVENAQARSFLDYCLSAKQPGAPGARRYFDAHRLRPWLGNIMILDYLPESGDFKYRLYGSLISHYSGFDMTGKRVSEFKSKTGDFFQELYRDCIENSRLIHSRHTFVHSRYVCDWERILCPTVNEDLMQIVACNYPVKYSYATAFSDND